MRFYYIFVLGGGARNNRAMGTSQARNPIGVISRLKMRVYIFIIPHPNSVLLFQKMHVNLVHLVKGFHTSIFLQTSASMQPRMSPDKFATRLGLASLALGPFLTLFERRTASFQPPLSQRAPRGMDEAAKARTRALLPPVALKSELRAAFCYPWSLAKK